MRPLAKLLDEATGQIGPRQVRRFPENWDQGDTFEPLLTLRRSAAIQPLARNALHDSLAGPIANRVAAEFGVADAELRASWWPAT